MSRTFVVLTTHTTRHLRRSILGVACQNPAPDAVVVACDNDSSDVRELVQSVSGECADRLSAGLLLVQRPTVGACALAQNRNNAVRALAAVAPAPADALVFFDGDCCPGPGCVATHRRLLDRAGLVCAYRVDMTPEQTEAFDEAAVRAGGRPVDPTPEQHRALEVRDARYRRQMLIRSLSKGRLIKSHKPKILGANFSATFAAYEAVNGFDEGYLGYGSEDDDFARRVYAAGFRPAVGVRACVVFHQWHPTRKPEDWHQSPGARRFFEPWRARAERGLHSPAEQPVPTVRRMAAGRESERWEIAPAAGAAA